nr:protein kinase-like domain, concanavalin A-like lectin/glucanase domain protein [Tanacetum cinerariifolium]
MVVGRREIHLSCGASCCVTKGSIIKLFKLTVGRLFNGSSCGGIDMVIKDLDSEPKDIVAKFCGPSRWKELSKEASHKIIPCGDGSCWKTFKQIASLIPQNANETDEEVKSKKEVEEETKGEAKEEKEYNPEHFDTFLTMKELRYHEWLLKNPRPPWMKVKIRTGNVNNVKFLCTIGQFNKEQAYLDLESPINIMPMLHYNWIMSNRLEPRRKPSNPKKKCNFVARVKGLRVFVRNFTYEYLTYKITCRKFLTKNEEEIFTDAGDGVAPPAMFLALGWHLEELHVTWAHLEKKQTRLRTCTKIHQEVLYSECGDGVASIKRCHRDLSGGGV